MSYVKSLVRKRSHIILPTIDPQAKVLDALKKLEKLDVSALLVIDNKDKILGIFSERDYARKIFLEGRQSPFTLVQNVMTKEVLYVGLDNTIEECMFIMVEKGVRHLPVLDNNDLIDFLSMNDVVKSVVDDKDFLINQLTQYITGSQANQSKFLEKKIASKNNRIHLTQMGL